MKYLFSYFMLAFALFNSCAGTSLSSDTHTIAIKDFTDLHEFFRYRPGRPVVISGHRGGMLTGYPENCIESFEKTLTFLPSFFEIDPRLTKDSVIVLMHDETIDRTTNGTGRVSDYTYEELLQFRLVDREGNLTDFQIPTLEQCIEWSRGKTILNLDYKDVPFHMTADLLEKTGAVNVMLTVHSSANARYYYDRNPNTMFSAWIHNGEQYKEYEQSGIPWSSFMAYVGPVMDPEKQELYDQLRAKGVMCMISVAPTHDNAASDEEKIAGYRREMQTNPDVIETDYPYLFVELIP